MTPLVWRKQRYFSTTSMLCDRYSGFPPLRRKANKVLRGGVSLPFIGSLHMFKFIQLRNFLPLIAHYAQCPPAGQVGSVERGKTELVTSGNIIKGEVSSLRCLRRQFQENWVKMVQGWTRSQKKIRYAMRTCVCYLEIQQSRGKESNARFANKGHLRFVSLAFGFHCGRLKPGTWLSFFHFPKFVMNFLKKCCLNFVVGGWCAK